MPRTPDDPLEPLDFDHTKHTYQHPERAMGSLSEEDAELSELIERHRAATSVEERDALLELIDRHQNAKDIARANRDRKTGGNVIARFLRNFGKAS